MEINELLKQAVDMGASDVHLGPGRKPMARINGRIKPISADYPPLDEQVCKEMIFCLLNDEQKTRFEQTLELDCSYQLQDISRFRINVHMQKDGVGAVLRVIGSQIPEPETIGLGKEIIDLCDLPRGLVLVTGTTGSGKSTTLAVLIDQINQRREDHILTIEDPIEFIYSHKNSIVTQREVGSQTNSFENALRSALREDPDIILVGEMRDLETIQLALTITETGHLVFGTLHTTDAPETIDRIIDVFPPYQQQQIRTMLSVSLEAVICQTLLPRADGKGRIAAREIMLVTPAIANLIREGKSHQIYNAIDTGAKFGMISMDRSLANLVKEGVITREVAESKANDLPTLRGLLGESMADVF